MAEALASTIQRLRVRAVSVPMDPPHRTASGVVSESPLVLTDLTTDDGVTGHSIVFTYTVAALGPTAGLIQNLEPLVKGERLAPAAITHALRARFRLLGTQGLVGMALAALDMALWDAMARTVNLSLARLLGATRSLCGRPSRGRQRMERTTQKETDRRKDPGPSRKEGSRRAQQPCARRSRRRPSLQRI